MGEGVFRHPVFSFPFSLVRRYLRHGVGQQAAALAFYLLFMLFPLLIFFSALLGLLEVDVVRLLQALGGVVPEEVLRLLGAYLYHVQTHSSPRLAMFALVFSVWFPMRAAKTLIRAVRTAYHLGPPRTVMGDTLRSLAYTVMLMGTMALTLGAITVTDRLLDWSVYALGLPKAAAKLWGTLRFPTVGAAGFFALYSLYALAQNGRARRGDIWPGTAFSLCAWLGVSWLYRAYVENFANYSVLYGSIGAVIALLIWLNMTAVVLIMGAEINGELLARRGRKEPKGEAPPGKGRKRL